MTTSLERREELKLVYEQALGCMRCPRLAATRDQVVFGAGNADADLMLVGEAPGANEDREGLPFVGQAGKLLDQLLAEIGLSRSEVFIANVLMCRPPGNRDPHPGEIENCQAYLMQKLELIQPKVVCTLGNFATKLLRGDPAGITRVHGSDEVHVIGRRAVRVVPLYHPAAALYTPRMLEVLREDFARLPALLAQDMPEQPVFAEEEDPGLDAELLAGAEVVGEVDAPARVDELTLLDVLEPVVGPGPARGAAADPAGAGAVEPAGAAAADPAGAAAAARGGEVGAGGVDPPIPGQLGLF